jgi:hypothetical protein
MSAPLASLKRAKKAISATTAFQSAGREHLLRTGGDQDEPRTPIPNGKPIPKRPQQKSADNNPAGQGYPSNQPQRPGTQPEPYRPPGPPYQPEAYGSPRPGDQPLGQSAGYYADHPQGFQAQGGYFAAPSGASRPYPSQHQQQMSMQEPPYPPPQQQQQQQRSMDHFSQPSQYSQPGFQPLRAYSTPSSETRPNLYSQTPSSQQQRPEPLHRILSWPQVAEPATIAPSSNPQLGNCTSCGNQRFINP